jgi:solute carrier family 10 (sodium/bile acid cotransporter), member 7
LLQRIDPMVRLLLCAIVLASLLPVRGAARDAAQLLSSAAVFILFLLYGLKLGRAEVLAGLGNRALLLPLAVWVFGVMAAAGWGLWHLTMPLLPPLLALGFLYLGTLPSTIQAAVSYSALAGGNAGSSVVAAALVNVLGVFITAPLFALLAGSQGAAIHGAALIKVFLMLLLPFLLGQIAQTWTGNWARNHQQVITFLDRGAIAISVYVAFSGAVTQGLWSTVAPCAWAVVLAGCAVLLVFGYAGAWALGAGLRLSRGDRISLLFAGAQKSAAMGAPLATVLFPPAIAGVIIVPLLTYHLAQMIVAAPIAARLRQQTI